MKIAVNCKFCFDERCGCSRLCSKICKFERHKVRVERTCQGADFTPRRSSFTFEQQNIYFGFSCAIDCNICTRIVSPLLAGLNSPTFDIPYNFLFNYIFLAIISLDDCSATGFGPMHPQWDPLYPLCPQATCPPYTHRRPHQGPRLSHLADRPPCSRHR